LQNSLAVHLRELDALSVDELLSRRATRLADLGVFKEA